MIDAIIQIIVVCIQKTIICHILFITWHNYFIKTDLKIDSFINIKDTVYETKMEMLKLWRNEKYLHGTNTTILLL